MHIAIAGNIGSGKTTLTTLLSKHFKWKAHYEDVENNPYLNDFYKEMQRWAFNLQVYFLNSRFRQIIDIKKSGDKYIQDRTIYEDAYIFAPNLHSMGLMSSRDFENYKEIFNLMDGFIDGPDLLIYLRASVPKLVEQIQKSFVTCKRLDVEVSRAIAKSIFPFSNIETNFFVSSVTTVIL